MSFSRLCCVVDYFMQQFLYFFPLPQGQGSFLPKVRDLGDDDMKLNGITVNAKSITAKNCRPPLLKKWLRNIRTLRENVATMGMP